MEGVQCKHLIVINLYSSESELVSVIFCSCGGEMGFSETGECVVIIFMIMRWLCLAVHLYPWNWLLKKVVWKRACGLEDGYVAVFVSPLFLFRLLCLLQ